MAGEALSMRALNGALLGFDERSRVIPPGTERAWWNGTVLVDGFAAGDDAASAVRFERT